MLRKLSHFVVRRIELDTNDGIFEGKLTIGVFDTDDVQTICTELKMIENVTEAARI